ncbi:unnamed protein product [Hydatigera taeniaeformis]|uniref:Disulfide bond formation protein B n=1 Tax=Hydatigena taeniaeformis TaxID=6205 RepID=A0A0R3WU78_HYDTA|nr:unnamed protein product [Hydatigera taeniaeformis]
MRSVSIVALSSTFSGFAITIFIGLFILLIEMPFCCAFIPQTEFIARAVDKMGHLPIAIICIIVGIIAMAMCPSFSMGFALLFLLASAAVRIWDFVLAR